MYEFKQTFYRHNYNLIMITLKAKLLFKGNFDENYFLTFWKFMVFLDLFSESFRKFKAELDFNLYRLLFNYKIFANQNWGNWTLNSRNNF